MAVHWVEFAAAAPDIAEGGRKLIYQHGIGLGYLATVRADGGPRVHPFCPILHEGRLYGLIAESPKQRDLVRDGRFAIHTFPMEEVDDEFYCTGRAAPCDDAALVEAVRATAVAAGMTSTGDERCFEFLLESALLATYGPRPAWPPAYLKWHAREGQ
jgi:hypothetical protein